MRARAQLYDASASASASDVGFRTQPSTLVLRTRDTWYRAPELVVATNATDHCTANVAVAVMTLAVWLEANRLGNLPNLAPVQLWRLVQARLCTAHQGQ